MYIDRFGGTWRGTNNNIDNAIYWMTKVAGAGTDEINVDAMFHLGNLCDYKLRILEKDEKGNITDYDPAERYKCTKMTQKWFQRAADLGYTEAARALSDFKDKYEKAYVLLQRRFVAVSARRTIVTNSLEVGDNFKCKKIYVDMVNALKENS